jgi:hypothetical protein
MGAPIMTNSAAIDLLADATRLLRAQELAALIERNMHLRSLLPSPARTGQTVAIARRAEAPSSKSVVDLARELAPTMGSIFPARLLRKEVGRARRRGFGDQVWYHAVGHLVRENFLRRHPRCRLEVVSADRVPQ